MLSIVLMPLIKHLKRLKRVGIQHVKLSDTSKVTESDDFASEQALDAATINVTINLPPPPVVTIEGTTKEEQYQALKARILSCPVCNAHVKPGKKVVVGSGNLDSKLFFCGEAPGGEEEVVGEVFVGKAGQLLVKIIQAMGLQRSDVYIGNIMNWRPEMPTAVGNRPPTQQEMEFCLPYLKAQVKIVQPEVIIALGATAVHGLLGHDSSRRMGQVRGNWFSFENTPLLITFHPSYLLRNNTNAMKRVVWEDMLKVMERTHIPISEKQMQFFKDN
ncbi:MAG: hypothetical protein A2Y14_00085 [Verrucomicrobia bacterium GWF2_51_19]|nr:MAG: hypothetical protein A2Y14_00085 [Verrucomicrobia bacterium GWF2_51_19]